MTECRHQILSQEQRIDETAFRRVRGRVFNLAGCVRAIAAAISIGTSSVLDEIISTLPRRVLHWLRLDLPQRAERLGVPVTIVTAAQADRPWEA